MSCCAQSLVQGHQCVLLLARLMQRGKMLETAQGLPGSFGSEIMMPEHHMTRTVSHGKRWIYQGQSFDFFDDNISSKQVLTMSGLAQSLPCWI